MSWKSGLRRFAARGLILQVQLLAGAVGCIAILAGIGVLVLVGGSVAAGTRTSHIAAAVVFAGCIVGGFGVLFLARMSRRVDKFGTAVNAAVARAETQDRRVEEALAGGRPGQVSVAEPEGAGQLSDVRDAGSVSLPPRKN